MPIAEEIRRAFRMGKATADAPRPLHLQDRRRLTALSYPEREIAVHASRAVALIGLTSRRLEPGSARRGGYRRLEGTGWLFFTPELTAELYRLRNWSNGLQVNARCHTVTKLR